MPADILGSFAWSGGGDPGWHCRTRFCLFRPNTRKRRSSGIQGKRPTPGRSQAILWNGLKEGCPWASLTKSLGIQQLLETPGEVEAMGRTHQSQMIGREFLDCHRSSEDRRPAVERT